MQHPTRDNLIEELFSPVTVRAYTSSVELSLIDTLRAEEVGAITSMTVARQAEFGTARACARAGLADLGIDAAIPKRSDGSPAWPNGIAGSISHSRGFCLAVTSSQGYMIGVDVEEIGRMSSGVERRILVDTEREDLAGLDEAGRQLHVATIFAAKEAFYKAHYELDARYLGFDVIAVRVGEMSLSFEVSSGAVGSEVIGRIVGRALVQDGRVIVGVSIGPAGSATGLPSRP